MYKFAIVAPCFNEEKTVKEVTVDLCTTFQETLVVIVDDGSTDRSLEYLQSLPFKNLKVINSEKNYGKGHAMRLGLNFVKQKCEIVIFTDADNEIFASDLQQVMNKYKESNVLSVFGSRFLEVSFSTIKKMGIERYLANRLITLIANLRYKCSLTDSCTAVKSFKSNMIDKLNLNSSGFEIEPEIIKGLSENSILIHEVPVRYKPRSYKEGKKISFKDGIITIRELFK
tara:strand:- start:451 stop:1134 length:684 start_codon:yes stop_codon:yes gene_type:complete